MSLHAYDVSWASELEPKFSRCSSKEKEIPSSFLKKEIKARIKQSRDENVKFQREFRRMNRRSRFESIFMYIWNGCERDW